MIEIEHCYEEVIWKRIHLANTSKPDEFSIMLEIKVWKSQRNLRWDWGKKRNSLQCQFLSWLTSMIYIYLTVNVVLISHRKWRIHLLTWKFFCLRQGHTPPSHLCIRHNQRKLSFAYKSVLLTRSRNFIFVLNFNNNKKNTRRKHQSKMQKML